MFASVLQMIIVYDSVNLSNDAASENHKITSFRVTPSPKIES